MRQAMSKVLVWAAVLAAASSQAGDSAPFFLDTMEGTRIARKTERIAYSTEWNHGGNVWVTADGAVLQEAAAPATGEVVWNATKAGVGRHTLTHVSGGETLTARFLVLDKNVALHAGTLAASETWKSNKVHLVTAAVTVPSGMTLTIQSGAVVKFMEGASLAVASGGACVAKGVIFTHVADDTAGGDTMTDGAESQPVMGRYTIDVDGTITDNDATEYRYMPPQTLSGTISSDTRLWGYRVYLVSNSVTVASGATLTLQLGTVLKFAGGCQLTVNGTLAAKGTRAAPIVFTSLKDDEHGGDSNGDGDKTAPSGGNWNGVWVYGKADLAHCELMYAGNGNERGILQTSGSGVLTMNACTVAHALNDGIWNWGGTIAVTNTVFIDTGWATAPYRGTKNEFVNCVFHGNDVGLCYWSHWTGKPVYRNCIFSECAKGWCELASGSYGAPPSGVTVSHCDFWNPAGFGAQSCALAGVNGNVWGDPLFVDAENGDFRLASAASPCVDAGDATQALEVDFWGQERVTARYVPTGTPNALGVYADIGIHEFLPEGEAGAYDLAAAAVSTATKKTSPGKTISVSWTVSNAGKRAVPDGWHDALALVSVSTGKAYALGEPVNAGALGAGEERTFTEKFTVPVVPEGSYRLRLTVNSRRSEVPEGSSTGNNAVLSAKETSIAVAATATDAGASGKVAAGGSAVLAFAVPAGSGDLLLQVAAAAGGGAVSGRVGLGHLPAEAGSGAGLVFADGEAWLSIPAGTETVWVVLDNGGTAAAAYTADFRAGSLVVTGVAPPSVPASGKATIEITGAGFTDVCQVKVGKVAADAVRCVGDSRLVATLDCAKLTAGAKYALSVTKGSATKKLSNAISVAAGAGEGKFWAKLSVPESVREGRKVLCSIEYGNSGNADVAAQVMQVKVLNNGSLLYEGNSRKFKDIHFVAATTPNGTIAAGDSGRIHFILLAGASSKLQLHTDSFDDGVALSSAAATVFAREGDMNDYRLVVDELSVATAIGSTTLPEYRSCYPDVGAEVSLRVDAGDWHEESIAFSAKNIETLEVHMPNSMDEECGEFRGLSAGGYRIFAESENFVGTAFALVGGTSETVSVAMKRKITVKGMVASSSEDDMAVFIGEDDTYYAMVDANGAYEVMLPAGVYDALVMSPSGTAYTPFEDLAIISSTKINFAKPKGLQANAGANSRSVPTRTDYNDKLFETKYTQALKRILEGDRLHSLAHAAYVKPSGEYDCPHNWEIYLENHRRAEIFRCRLQTFAKNARMADPYKALALLGKSIHDTARAYLDYWLASKAKFATARFGTWAGGIASAKQQIVSYGFVAGLDAVEETIGTFETDVKSLQYLIEHRELSVRYVTQILDKIASIKDGFSSIKGDLDALAAAGTILHSDVKMFESNLFSDKMWDYINTAATMAELVSDWLKTGESGGEWLAGRLHIDEWMADFEAVMRDFAAWLPPRPYLLHCCDIKEGEDISDKEPLATAQPKVPKSCDPNEMKGPEGTGAKRYVVAGEGYDYTIYFENRTNATAAAAEVRVTQALSAQLDWSSFEMVEVSYGETTDTGLEGKANGTSEREVEGAGHSVRTEVALDAKTGVATWYLRVVDPAGDEDGWPLDPTAGFLPPNDKTHRGEGHITYRVKVKKTAKAGAKVNAAASIVFDYNDPIETDPAWWNTVRVDVPLTVWRFYSKNYKGHFFTISEAEKDGLIAGNPNWKFEGGAYRAYTNAATGTVALHRFYSKGYRGHFFTIDEEEKETIRTSNPNWKYEGVAYYVYPKEAEGTVPVFRFWSKGYRHHFYTTSEEERDGLIKGNPNWKYEGVAFWALPLEGAAGAKGQSKVAGVERLQGREQREGGEEEVGEGEEAASRAGRPRPQISREGSPSSGRIGGGVVVTTCDGSDGSAVADGDEGTGWSPAEGWNGAAWVVLAFAEPVEVESVDVVGENLPEGARVLVSEDAEEWGEVGEWAGEEGRYVWVAWDAKAGGETVIREIWVRNGNKGRRGAGVLEGGRGETLRRIGSNQRPEAARRARAFWKKAASRRAGGRSRARQRASSAAGERQGESVPKRRRSGRWASSMARATEGERSARE